MKGKEIRLSQSTLNLFLECPRCFWLQYNRGIKRPKGIFATLLGKMDREVKEYFDKFRGDLPPELKGKTQGELIDDVSLLRQWRNTRKPGLIYYIEPEIRLAGALDDCLFLDGADGRKQYIPIDSKSRGSGIEKEPIPPYYQNQMDCYALLLEKCGYPGIGIGYLVYYILKKIEANGLGKFDVEVVKVETDPQRALNIIQQAIAVLKGPMPETHPECEYCRYRET